MSCSEKDLRDVKPPLVDTTTQTDSISPLTYSKSTSTAMATTHNILPMDTTISSGSNSPAEEPTISNEHICQKVTDSITNGNTTYVDEDDMEDKVTQLKKDSIRNRSNHSLCSSPQPLECSDDDKLETLGRNVSLIMNSNGNELTAVSAKVTTGNNNNVEEILDTFNEVEGIYFILF